jgi:hypothetical protein
MFQQRSTSDINLQGTLFMFRTFFSITTAAAAVARIPFVRLASIIFIIIGRGFWRCSTLSSPLLFKHLKEAKKEMYEKPKDRIS